jgi:hypothetical protein
MTLSDIVYVVRPGDMNEELRYSLRSLVNLPHERVWLAGHRPSWVRGVSHIPVTQEGTKYQNSTANLRAACESADVSESFILMNDDFFICQPVAFVPPLHRGPVDSVEAYYASRGRGLYLRGLRETRDLLATLGYPSPLSYELHVPMPMTKKRVREMLKVGGHLPVLHKRTLYGNLFELGGAQIPDPKVLTRSPRFPRDAVYLSTMPDTFANGQVGAHIRATFPHPGPYETGTGRRP